MEEARQKLAVAHIKAGENDVALSLLDRVLSVCVRVKGPQDLRYAKECLVWVSFDVE